MAAQGSVVLENHLKQFVENKVGEEVFLDFSIGSIYIRPVKKGGSTTLGAFWVRVIQAYFPSPEFTYTKNYSSSHGSEVLTTVADDYAIKIYLRTGLVVIEGDVVYEWFKVIFRKVMQHYDNSTYSLPLDYRNDQLIIDARREIQKKEKKNLFLDYAQPEIIDEKLAFVSSDVKMTELDQRFAANKESGKLASVSSNAGLTTWMGLQDGNSQVYLLWKQLLNKWLSTDGCKVYICTRQMDIQRYKDLSIMAYKNRLHDGLEAIYTCGRSAAGMTADKTSLLRGHSAEEQLFIEYRILNKTKLTTTKKISCNFIAGMYPRQSVELMITSATFDAEGLDKSQNLHTVSVSNMAIETFTSEFIDRLSAL